MVVESLQLHKLRYRACFEQGAPWHQTTTECRFTLNAYAAWQKYTIKKSRSTVLLNYFIHSIINASWILHGGAIAVGPSKDWVKTISIWSEKLSCLSSYLILPHKKNDACLTNSQYSIWLLKKYSRLQHLLHSGHL